MVGKTIQLINIFVGGPGDCEKFKELAKNATREINKIKGDKEGITLQVVTSADVNKRQGNPQNQINTEVIDSCDVFLTFFSARCGTPTGNSKHESGSIEEFYRVLQRAGNGHANEPVIKVFFDSKPQVGQTVPDAKQFYKLSQFKEKIYNEHSIYCETFETELECAEKLRLHLSKIIDLHSASHVPGREDQYKKVSNPHKIESLKEDDKKSTASSQKEADTLEVIRNSLASSNIDTLLGGLHELKMFEKTHLKLLLQIAMSDVYGEELLNNHHINLLYKNRTELLPTDIEKHHLFRTLLRCHYNGVPGWYWLKSTKPKFLMTQLTKLVLSDPSADVRKGAIDLLKLSNSFPPDEALKKFSKNRETFILDILQDGSKEVSASAIEYLKIVGNAEDIKTIQTVPVSEQLHGLIANILSKDKNNDALAYMLKNNVNIDNETISSLKGKTFDKETLVAATANQNIEIAKFGFEELISRSDFPDEQLMKMLKDTKPEIKELCLRELIKRNQYKDLFTADFIRKFLGEGVTRLGGLFQFGPNTDGVVQQFYESLSDEKLLNEISWMGIDADIAYEVYAKRKPNFIIQVREDLKDNFDRLKLQWEQDVKVKYGDKATDEINYKDKEKVEEYIRNKFRAAALNALAINSDHSDLPIARDLIQKDDNAVKEGALKIIQKRGDESDMKIAWEVAKNSYGNLKNTAEKVFFDIAPKSIKTVLLALEGNSSMAKKALEFALNNKIILEELVLADLLLRDSEMIRESAISYLVKTCDETRLTKWLNAYLQQDSYYYDVPCWLDRVLYAVEPFKAIWKQKLISKI